MWRKIAIFILIVLFVSISGCSQFGKNPASNQTAPRTAGGKPVTTAIPLPAPKYTMGDIVKTSPGDNIGKIIIDYDLKGRKYTVRTVIYDDFGRIYYIKEQKEQSVPFATIESSYPVKTGNIDNPYGISELSYTKPKFADGTIHREEVNKNDGIIILSFNYLTDEYTFAYAYYQGGGIWDYDKGAKHTGDRVAIEAQYKK